MPIYEYYCEPCDKEFEVIQKISDDVLTECPECKQKTLKKLTSMSAFHLKGGGWYKDGYGNGSSGSDTSPPAATSVPEKTGAKTDSTEKSDTPKKADTPAKTVTSETTAKPADSKSKAS